MRYFFFLLFSLAILPISKGQFVVSEVGNLPDRVSNNAVCEGFVDGLPFLFSFGGIDSTKIYSGIHLKSYRFNVETGESERIADLPDDLGKIGVGASRIGNIIYIAGGYNVFSNNTEKTTHKMHRYDINNNLYLTNAKDIPVPTDDHVQVVWRDSLIYLITGWNNTANIPNVQIYDPSIDEWSEGTAVPNLDTYKAFGASGVIVNDTIYYFGGARSSGNFGIQNKLRIGAINPEDPTDIQWSIITPELLVNGYRMAATAVDNEIHWIGGSNKTYNFNGIAYDGSGSVPPSKRDLYLTTSKLEWNQKYPIEIPMDLRGIANVNKTTKYIAGGMLDNREVTNKVYKLERQDPTLSTKNAANLNLIISPNPFQEYINVKNIDAEGTIEKIDILDINGSQIYTEQPNAQSVSISASQLPAGIYLLRIKLKDKLIFKKVIKML
jgi:hypothetical protein